MAEIERESVCLRIGQARKEAGLTQQEVADALDITLRSYQDYESFRVPFRRLEQLAEILGVTKRWLLYGDMPAALDGIEPPSGSSELLDAIRELTAELRLRRLNDEGEAGSA